MNGYSGNKLMNKILIRLLAVGVILICLFSVYVCLSSRGAKTAAVKSHMIALRDKLQWKWRDGLPNNLAFATALSAEQPDWFELGKVDVSSANPLPEFFPKGIYHYEKGVPREGQSRRRVILWTQPEGAAGPSVVLYSDWSIKLLQNEKIDLPTWEMNPRANQ